MEKKYGVLEEHINAPMERNPRYPQKRFGIQNLDNKIPILTQSLRIQNSAIQTFRIWYPILQGKWRVFFKFFYFLFFIFFTIYEEETTFEIE